MDKYNIRIYTKWKNYNSKCKYFEKYNMNEKRTHNNNTIYYELKDLSKKELNSIYRHFSVLKMFMFSKADGISIKYYNNKWERSSNYRYKLINETASQGYKRRCVYCGVVEDISDIQVDHIIPVIKLTNSSKARSLAAFLNIKDTNDLNNLVFACKKCNKSKGSSLSLYWIIKAKLGKSEFYWKIKAIIDLIILVIILYVLYHILNGGNIHI